MEIKIQSRHFKPNDELLDFVQQKMNHLSHLKKNILAGDVCLKLEKSDTSKNKVCEIRLSVPDNDLFSKRQCETFEEAATQAVEALQKQLRKRKTQTMRRRRG